LTDYFPWLTFQAFTENTFVVVAPDLLLVVGFSSYFSANFHSFLMTDILALGFF
jgi:hypothetical protein